MTPFLTEFGVVLSVAGDGRRLTPLEGN